ncbi:FtsX-like permease family protein, partial [Klebsiella pneumoniae]|nr:FtsX-like permease family protein [Klebsiella pneumoniae]
GILFSTLFFIQIVNRGEEQNGLLLALGYEPRQISRIYVRCALILSLGSAVFGFALGFFLLQTMLKLYIGLYDLPFLAYDGSVWLF